MTENNHYVIQVSRVEGTEDLPLPQFATPASAGMDIYAANSLPITLKPLERVLIPTGLKIALPRGLEMQIRPRSGLALKNGLTILNSPGTIDSDYRGEVQVLVINLSNESFIIERGMRIAQAVIAKHEQAIFQVVTTLDNTLRGAGGFGHSGIK